MIPSLPRSSLSQYATAAYVAWLLIGAANAIPALLLAGAAIGVMWSRWLASRQRSTGSYARFVIDTWDVHVLGLVLLLGLVYQQTATEGITSDGCLY